MDYLTLVNEVIEESESDLDLLTSANFAAPPRTTQYRRIKRWVNQAYQEIIAKREEWHYRAERTFVNLYPRIRVNSVIVPILVGDTYVAVDSGVGFTVVNVVTNADDPDGDVMLDILYDFEDETQMIIGEHISRVTPTGLANLARLEGSGGYDLAQYIPTVDEVDARNIYIQESPDVVAAMEPAQPQLLVAREYNQWPEFALREWQAADKPQYITVNAEGLLEFFPRLDREYSFIFPYSRKVGELVLWDDTAQPIPDNLHMVIVWAAVMKAANRDGKQKLFLNAQRSYRFWNNLLENKTLPTPQMPQNQFWA